MMIMIHIIITNILSQLLEQVVPFKSHSLLVQRWARHYTLSHSQCGRLCHKWRQPLLVHECVCKWAKKRPL